MQRIQKLDAANASEKTEKLLAAVKAQMGGVPNILATMAHSAASLEGYLGFATALGSGVFNAGQREQIALAIAGANTCDYCASVHTAVGRKHGLSSDELAANLRGQSSNAKMAAALRFVRAVVNNRGHIGDEDIADVLAAGHNVEETVELIAHTALNIFTNYFNHIAGTEIDFPFVGTAEVPA